MEVDTDMKQDILDTVESLGLEACTNLDRLNFELNKSNQELAILQMKRDFFTQFPDKFLKTKMGTFIGSGDKEHSEHTKHSIQERIKFLKKEIRQEKVKLAFAPGYENYIAEETHLKLVRKLEA